MTSLTSAAIVALTAAVVGSAGLATSASAQQQPPMQPHMQMPGNGQGFGFNNHHRRDGQFGQFGDQRRAQQDGGGIRAGALLDLVCSERGAEALEVGLVRMSYRLDLTDAQKPLFDDLRTTALSAQTGFADQCAAARPAPAVQSAQATPPTPPTPVERITTTIALEKARLAALETLLPKFEAFYNSLTADQQAQLEPRNRRGGPNMPGMPGMPGQPGGMPMQPGGPGMAPAPGDEGAPPPPPANG